MTAHDQDGKPSALLLINRLCRAVDAERIGYCHWKSNIDIDRAVSGEEDLDLLISRADLPRFVAILGRLGFRSARVPPAAQLPGVEHYFGHDAPSGRLVHIHAHYQLVLGHDLTKNVRLPIERILIESATTGYPLKTSSAEFELILFVIRMMLKHATADTLLGRQGRLTTPEQRELAHLSAIADPRRLHAVLQQYLPCVAPDLFRECLASLDASGSMWQRHSVGRRLQRAMVPYMRHGKAVDLGRKTWRRSTKALCRRAARHMPRKRLLGGGAIIALVGGDGAGKSTAVAGLHDWLSRQFDVRTVHMGKPTPSRTTVFVRACLKVGRMLRLVGSATLLKDVCKARDRYLAYVRARRFSANGGLVICDRYPLPQIKLMDAMKSNTTPARASRGRISKFLGRIARNYYRNILTPDLLIVLYVDSETAVRRKTNEQPDHVRSRCQEVAMTSWPPGRTHLVDASQPKTE
ncbi:MAG TPA: hypothetical protein VE890_18245, partial [Thermoguttaceae bacterium]|nr:hypothetical protein [Thermoguttaceae bacterium]